MSREILVKKLKKKIPKLSKSEIIEIINIFCDSIKIALKNNKDVELRGFGSFFVKKIKEKYSSRNPKTGDLIYTPEKNKIRFRLSKKLQKDINE